MLSNETRHMEKKLFITSKVIAITGNTYNTVRRDGQCLHGKMIAVAYGTMIGPRRAPLCPKQIDGHEFLPSGLQKYGIRMGRDLDCMVDV